MKKPDKKTRDVSAALRATEALKLYTQGFTYEEVAVKAGYASRGAAHNAIQRELSRYVAPAVEQARALSLARLDQWQRNIAPMLDFQTVKKKSKDGTEYETTYPPNIEALRTALMIEERRAKLLGLDTPVKMATPPMAQVLIQQVNFSPEAI